jgi:putative FmdB family regulatory protein
VPVYEFYCPACGVRFEVLRPRDRMEEDALCPAGHRTANRVLSLVAATPRVAASAGAPEAAAGGCACGGSCACGGH